MLENKNIIYNAEDMQRYFSGNMSAAEMHAMENAALTDPLLADAMEGYHTLPVENFATVQQQLDQLKEKFSGKTINIKKYDYRFWKLAAAILLLVGSVFAFYQFTKTKNNDANNLAKQQTIISAPQENKSIGNAAAKTDSVFANKTLTDKTADNNLAVADEKQQKISINNQQVKIKKNELTASPQAKDADKKLIATNDKPVYSFSTLPKNASGAQPLADNNYSTNQNAESQSAYANRALSNSEKSRLYKKKAINFSGKVTDANNAAIPFANLIINNQQQAKTDANGFFNLSLTDSVIRLDVAAKNYYPSTKNITANNFADIVLTAKRNTIKKRQALTDSFTRSQVQILYKTGVEPKEGWEKYRLFLVDQLSNSEYDNDMPVSGQTIVRFEIDRNMQPTNFSFPKSIDEDVNDAIENLILTGPEWRIAENGGIPGIVELRITF